MTGDKKTIVSLLVDAGASKQNIEEVTGALVKSGDSGIKAASQITQGLEAIEANSEKALGKVANGAQVSDAALKQLAARFVSVEEGVAAAFGSIEAAPEAIQTAMATAEAQIVAVNAVVVGTGVSVDEMAAKFAAAGEAAVTATTQAAEGGAAVEASMVGAGEATGVAAESMNALAEGADRAETEVQGLATAAESATSAERALGTQTDAAIVGFDELQVRVDAVQAVIDRYYAAIEAGDAPSRMVVRKLTIQYETLKQSIIETFGSIEAATPEAIAAYQELGVQVDALIAQQGKYALAVNLANNEVKLASGQALSAQKAMAAMAGSMGGVVVQGFLMATMAGIAVQGLDKLSDALQYDEKSGNSFKEKAVELASAMGDIKRDAYDSGAAFVQLGHDVSILTGDTVKAKSSALDFEHSLEVLALGVLNTKEQAGGLRAEIAAGLPILERSKSTFDQLEKVNGFYNTTLSRGALGQKEWSAAVKESGGTLEGLLASIDKHTALMVADTKALKDITDAEQEVQREHKKTVDAIQQEIDALNKHVDTIKKWAAETGTQAEVEQKLLTLFDKEIAIIKNLDQAHNGTTTSISKLLAIIQQHLQYGDRFSQQLAGEASLLKSLTQNTDGLNYAERKRLDTIAASIKLVGESTAKQKDLQTQLNAELDSLNVLKGASREELDARVEKIHKLEDEIAQTNAAVAAQKAQVLIQQQQAAATKTVSDATVLATGNIKDGTGAIQNTGEAYEKAKDQAKDSGDAIIAAAIAAAKSGEGFDSTTVKVNAAKDSFKNLSEAVDSTAKAADRIHDSQLKSLANDFQGVAEAMKSGLLQNLKDANEEAEKLARNLNVARDAAHALANAGDTTAGNNPYPNVTEGP
jgi:hypothetical protein